MKRIITAGAIIIAASVLIAAGVLAATRIDWGTSATVSFKAPTGCSVTVQGAIARSGTIPALPTGTVNSASEYYQATISSSALPDWTATELAFDTGNPVISMQLKFTNDGIVPVQVDIELPAAITNTALTGGNNTTGFGDTTPEDTHTATLDASETATFTYKLSLMDYSKNIPKVEGNFSFTVTLTPATP